jgi:hypothetical protein
MQLMINFIPVASMTGMPTSPKNPAAAEMKKPVRMVNPVAVAMKNVVQHVAIRPMAKWNAVKMENAASPVIMAKTVAKNHDNFKRGVNEKSVVDSVRVIFCRHFPGPVL